MQLDVGMTRRILGIGIPSAFENSLFEAGRILVGHLPRYFMSNISLEKMLSFKPLDVQLKLAVNNLFNEDYLSVLSRPMPGINFEFFIGITPKFGKSRK